AERGRRHSAELEPVRRLPDALPRAAEHHRRPAGADPVRAGRGGGQAGGGAGPPRGRERPPPAERPAADRRDGANRLRLRLRAPPQRRRHPARRAPGLRQPRPVAPALPPGRLRPPRGPLQPRARHGHHRPRRHAVPGRRHNLRPALTPLPRIASGVVRYADRPYEIRITTYVSRLPPMTHLRSLPLFLAAFVLAACGGDPAEPSAEAGAADTAVPVEVVAVEPAPFEDVIELT